MTKALTRQDIKHFKIGLSGIKTDQGYITSMSEDTVWTVHKITDCPSAWKISSIKPYLRNLDQLTQEITHGGETFTPASKLSECSNGTWYEDDWIDSLWEDTDAIDLKVCPLGMAEMLYEWNFNVGNLHHDLFIELKEETKEQFVERLGLGPEDLQNDHIYPTGE